MFLSIIVNNASVNLLLIERIQFSVVGSIVSQYIFSFQRGPKTG